ncbi:MAG: DUF6434 domain-containing protein [Pseudomonadota bacterium]
MSFDWHGGGLSRDLPLDRDFRMTQNVRRFIAAETGHPVRVPREFHDWLKAARPATLGHVIDEWVRRYV